MFVLRGEHVYQNPGSILYLLQLYGSYHMGLKLLAALSLINFVSCSQKNDKLGSQVLEKLDLARTYSTKFDLWLYDHEGRYIKKKVCLKYSDKKFTIHSTDSKLRCLGATDIDFNFHRDAEFVPESFRECVRNGYSESECKSEHPSLFKPIFNIGKQEPGVFSNAFQVMLEPNDGLTVFSFVCGSQEVQENCHFVSQENIISVYRGVYW